jgi:hypothetical protein
MRDTIGAFTLALALSVVPGAAQAAPAEQPCYIEAHTARDMAGTYTSSLMTVVVHPCGGVFVEWENGYGVHTAVYATQARVPGQGIIARSDPANVRRLDTSSVLGVKAAERGFVQVFTVNDITGEERVYRLRKIA